MKTGYLFISVVDFFHISLCTLKAAILADMQLHLSLYSIELVTFNHYLYLSMFTIYFAKYMTFVIYHV